MRFVGNYALRGLSPQTDGMPVILKKESPVKPVTLDYSVVIHILFNDYIFSPYMYLEIYNILNIIYILVPSSKLHSSSNSLYRMHVSRFSHSYSVFFLYSP